MGLAPARVPQLVAVGFDDNSRSGLDASGGGVQWAVDMARGLKNPQGRGQSANADDTSVRLSFYMASTCIDAGAAFGETRVVESPITVKRAWRAALEEGHEIGNHTHTHAHGSAFAAAEWRREIERCTDRLSTPFDGEEAPDRPNPTSGIGVATSELHGFRAPYLEYNDALFGAVKALDFRYDCSVEDGWQAGMDGTNYHWPYTLDGGCPAVAALTPHPGLWELPAHPVIVPPDDRCEQYGVPPGLRRKLRGVSSHFDEQSGKITGFDYNLWVAFRMTKAEFLATLKYSLDLRRQGNRAPFLLGAHTDYYSSDYMDAPNATAPERRAAMEEFLAYALSQPEIRVASLKQVLDWVRNPVPIAND